MPDGVHEFAPTQFKRDLCTCGYPRGSMIHVRRGDTTPRHVHRYPSPNSQGFPVNQCLDCGEKTARGRW
jgi:hypothetical protein